MKEPLLLCADGGSTRLVVGVVQGGRLLAQAEHDAFASHGVAILSLVEQVLAASHAVAAQLDALVLAGGPGSFTGLRTAMSTFKGLALGWGKPLLTVSTLHALARSAPYVPGTLRVACLDARKGEVYVAAWRLGETASLDTCVLEPTVLAPTAAAERVLALGNGVEWAGDGLTAHPTMASGHTSQWTQAVPALEALAACWAAHAGPVPPLETLEPMYVRQSYVSLSLGQKPASVPA